MKSVCLGVLIVFFSAQVFAEGSVFCLGYEMPGTGPESSVKALESCSYRVARARAALRGERRVQAFGYSNVVKFIDDQTGAYSLSADVTVQSIKLGAENQTTYVERVVLEGQQVTDEENVTIYIDEPISTLNIEAVNQ